MEQFGTAYGNLLIGSEDELFEKALEMLLIEASKRATATIGLPGGITPHKWYEWMIRNEALDAVALERICWMTSDERHVPQPSVLSNFGNAARLFLDPLAVPETRRMPWPTQVDPYSASIVFNRRWNERFGSQRCFDLCFLGLGDDGHMASIFPGSPFRGMDGQENFSSVEVPEKGWRLTITQTGLSRCGQILLIVMGKHKVKPLEAVFQTPYDPSQQPAHLLHDISDKVTWLVDHDAAEGLNLKHF